MKWKIYNYVVLLVYYFFFILMFQVTWKGLYILRNLGCRAKCRRPCNLVTLAVVDNWLLGFVAVELQTMWQWGGGVGVIIEFTRPPGLQSTSSFIWKKHVPDWLTQFVILGGFIFSWGKNAKQFATIVCHFPVHHLRLKLRREKPFFHVDQGLVVGYRAVLTFDFDKAWSNKQVYTFFFLSQLVLVVYWCCC